MTTKNTVSGRRHLIVVDDDATLLDITSQILREFTNADILSFADPREALRVFESEPDYFDLVVTDLEMPEMDGMKLSRAVHAGSPRVKSILVTGSRRDVSREAACEAGFEAVLFKPYSIDALTSAVQRALSDECPHEPVKCESRAACVARN